jgi:hypothetical protein
VLDQEREILFQMKMKKSSPKFLCLTKEKYVPKVKKLFPLDSNTPPWSLMNFKKKSLRR